MTKMNCWEFKKCGREPGGAKSTELGVCPAATEIKVANVNGGKNGGRCCWVIAGTLCGGKVQGSFALKYSNCVMCEFYKKVGVEEGDNMVKTKDILDKMFKK